MQFAQTQLLNIRNVYLKRDKHNYAIKTSPTVMSQIRVECDTMQEDGNYEWFPVLYQLLSSCLYSVIMKV